MLTPCPSVCICGGGPASGEFGSYVGGARWQDPGAFANGFKGVCSVFVTGKSVFCGAHAVSAFPESVIAVSSASA